jgi:nitrite reductase/ring-hydroxylating ferredoxin subunit
MPSRRSILAAGGVLTAAVAMSACASDSDQDAFSGGALTPAVSLEELPVGESVQLAVGSTQLLLYREDEETVHAYSAICTHQGCIVGVGENAPKEPFVCPCHASAFDRTTGEPVAGPASSPLQRHPTNLKDGWVHVEVESAD